MEGNSNVTYSQVHINACQYKYNFDGFTKQTITNREDQYELQLGLRTRGSSML